MTVLILLRMRCKSWKDLHKMASKNESNIFTLADRTVYLPKVTILKKIYFKLFNSFYFSEINWSLEYFEATKG